MSRQPQEPVASNRIPTPLADWLTPRLLADYHDAYANELSGDDLVKRDAIAALERGYATVTAAGLDAVETIRSMLIEGMRGNPDGTYGVWTDMSKRFMDLCFRFGWLEVVNEDAVIDGGTRFYKATPNFRDKFLRQAKDGGK